MQKNWCIIPSHGHPPTEEQYYKIEDRAKNILVVRKKYSNDTTLAVLYDPITMPDDLEKGHRKNDIALDSK